MRFSHWVVAIQLAVASLGIPAAAAPAGIKAAAAPSGTHLGALAQGTQAAAGAPSIQVITPLSFGGLLVQPKGGRVTLTATGSLLPEGVGVFPGASPPAEYGRIRLKGPAKANFHIRIDPATPVLQGSSGGLVHLAAFLPSLANLYGRFSTAGEAELDLGGTLDVPSRAPAGRYNANVHILMVADGVPDVTQVLSIYCTLRSPLTLAVLDQLNFAGLAPGPNRGTFNLDAAGGYFSAGTAGPLLVKGTPKPAAIRLTGTAGTRYDILLPKTIFLQGPGVPIPVQNFRCDRALSGSLPDAGLTFHVGAQLVMAQGQASGTYSGTFQISVVYP